MSRRLPDTNPRKLPRQERSKATVEAILIAATQVLIEEGYEGATTARVAERAGVSVGSLYQYFPNKEALVGTLVERHADEIVTIMHRALRDTAHRTLADGIRAVIRAGAEAHRIQPVLHKILYEQVPRVGRLGKAMDTHRKVTAEIEGFLRIHANELPADHDLATAAIVVETALEALVHKAVIDRHELLVEDLVEQETFRLITGYLFATCRGEVRL
ncbi:transcriptional regulator [Nitratireductor aquibiodomus RA22]|uniref:Transcriptional regulator n=1 Tax=Nitratireductor aquibiodomus RA22 TaxID=1189611 RepID=I5BRP2_9HYPH|nr:TetR/AcrR family transcriptional regulator [Nitratireductor aquibiodomus]EIM72244.1 transcriptional regulator [Nitratireductor aquibiodomus RA22]